VATPSTTNVTSAPLPPTARQNSPPIPPARRTIILRSGVAGSIMPLAGCFEPRIVGEFKPNAAWFPHHEMDFGLSRRAPERNSTTTSGQLATAFVQRIQPGRSATASAR